MATASSERPVADDATRHAQSLCEAFQVTAALEPERVALRTADGSLELTWAQYAARVQRIAAGLWSLGVRRGDTVALLMGNRPEFNLCDTAAVHLGATPFSIYSTSAPEQIAYLLANAKPRVVIAEAQYRERLSRADPPALICVDAADSGSMSLTELELQAAGADFDFESTWRSVTADDALTLIYTSGTTGPP
jgi:long-subunit acyl-CoA synthetase (AMP-forming)